MYDNGQGVPQDYKTAVKWYRLAAEQGYACPVQSGYDVRLRTRCSQDYKTAVKWYTLAAEQGNADAQGNLGVMYGMGTGIIQDWVYAHMWGIIAASNGNEDGAKLRDIAAEDMTPSQLEKAQDLARECVRKNYKGC